MKNKDLIECLQKLPQNLDVVMEAAGTALYAEVGRPYTRTIGYADTHRDCICIGREMTTFKLWRKTIAE